MANSYKTSEFLPTTPFTFNELQNLNLENQAFKMRLKKDFNLINVNEIEILFKKNKKNLFFFVLVLVYY
jgi:hypothetical protein